MSLVGVVFPTGSFSFRFVAVVDVFVGHQWRGECVPAVCTVVSPGRLGARVCVSCFGRRFCLVRCCGERVLPAQIEFVFAAAGFVHDLVEVIGGFHWLVLSVGVSAVVSEVAGSSVCSVDHVS